jgi:hypothetical protein
MNSIKLSLFLLITIFVTSGCAFNRKWPVTDIDLNTIKVAQDTNNKILFLSLRSISINSSQWPRPVITEFSDNTLTVKCNYVYAGINDHLTITDLFSIDRIIINSTVNVKLVDGNNEIIVKNIIVSDATLNLKSN